MHSLEIELLILGPAFFPAKVHTRTRIIVVAPIVQLVRAVLVIRAALHHRLRQLGHFHVPLREEGSRGKARFELESESTPGASGMINFEWQRFSVEVGIVIPI